MRKIFLSLAAGVALLAGCAEPKDSKMSREEEYFMNAYAVVTSAFAYDETCNASAASGNATLKANLNMISTQLYEAFRRNRPGAPDAVFKEAVSASGESMKESQIALIKEKGCDADQLKPFADALAHFTTIPPEVNHTQMMQDLNTINAKPAESAGAPK